MVEDDPLAEAGALIAGGRPGDAVALLESLHAAGRGGLLLQTMRARALIATGDIRGALAVAREASSLYPSVPSAALALGDAMLAAGFLPPAIGEFQRALRLDPDCAEARFSLGCAWLEAGEAEKAQDAFDTIASGAVPQTALAEKYAEIAAMRARPRSDSRYVRHLFDQFSHDYDARMLGQLGYGAPQILEHLAQLIAVPRDGGLNVLDLGCGTGLAGAVFHDYAHRLDGIDLSPLMLEKARARGLYDTLIAGDIETALRESNDVYDLILAADTLVYLGDLDIVFAGAARRLKSGGAFLFTVERKDGEGFELGPKRRWRHAEAYLRLVAARTGFDIAGLLECEPRSEAGKPVAGYAVAAVKE